MGANKKVNAAANTDTNSVMFLVLLNPLSSCLLLSLANIGKTATAENEIIADAEVIKLKAA